MMRDHMAQPALLRNTPGPTMPLDKQKSGTPAKPFTPTLSTAIRSSKSPLTPKLAGSKNVSPLSSPRRALRTDPSMPPTSRREDFRTPTTSKLSGNITPRSGARVSRIGADSPSTPGSGHVGTSPRARPLSAIELTKPRRYNGAGAGLGIEISEDKRSTPPVPRGMSKESLESNGVKRRVSTGSPRNAVAQSIPQRLSSANADPTVPHEVEQTLSTSKPATFFYASDVARRTISPEPLRAIHHPLLETEEQSKFCYANGMPTEETSASQRLAMAVSNHSPAASSLQSRPASIEGGFRDLHQPSSPTKAASLRSAPATLSSAGGSSLKVRIVDEPAKPKTTVTPSDTNRRASISSRTSTVRQTAQPDLSIASSAPSTPPKKAQLQISPRAANNYALSRQPAIAASPTSRFSPRSASLSSSNTGVSTQTLDSTPSNSIHPLSPAKSETTPSTQLQRTNELAANARRERKVLDLEISNSSLLAINRTLEREMRKQSLELRRFRRLSRASRLSTMSNSARSTSGQLGLSTVTESEDDRSVIYGSHSDLEEQTSNYDTDDYDIDSSFDDDSSLHSPTSQFDHDPRRRARDEKRLMLDLSKHQQLLIDSQKMNQSIKRCLGWTEELIDEGKKALAYHVKVSDVEIGGKVLGHDEEEAEGGGGSGNGKPRKGLLSPSLDIPIPPEVEKGRRLWRQGLEEMEMEVDRMLESSTTLKEEVPV